MIFIVKIVIFKIRRRKYLFKKSKRKKKQNEFAFITCSVCIKSVYVYIQNKY